MSIRVYHENAFVFDVKYRILRHIIFWLVHIIIFSFLFRIPGQNFGYTLLISTLWVPSFILYSYPVMYRIIPAYLLKEKYMAFTLILLLWAVGGYFLNYYFRTSILFPVADLLDYKAGNRNPWATNSYLSMNVMAGFGSIIVLFKYWLKKQKEFLSAEKEKTAAELQLLKAQIHPHFLFNTLNNIYAFSLKESPKTPGMIAKLSSLLSYILYDCKDNEMPLEKEIEVMQNYIDLERERHGNRLDVSMNVEGELQGRHIAPLLLLPFIENAFKHGTSEQLDKQWLSIDISAKKIFSDVKYLIAKMNFQNHLKKVSESKM